MGGGAMKALTIKQPWLWAITGLTDRQKRVENRTWKPPYGMTGQRIALHGSARIEQVEMMVWRRIYPEWPNTAALVTGAIVATAVIRGYVIVDDHGGVIEQSRYAENYDPRADPWFFGPVGWLLEDVRKLAQPMPCKGALGLWEVPPVILVEIEAQSK
jgi:hypothetical protein